MKIEQTRLRTTPRRWRPKFDFHTGMWADVGMLEGEMDQFLGLMPREIRWAMQGRPDKT